jgi:hypothetical protein
MCKMGKRAEQALPDPVRVLFIFLAACLLVHFLIEDSALQPQLAVAANAGAAGASLDELTHQDDLILSVSLPAQAALVGRWLIVPVILPPQTRACFPLLHPPKIATRSTGFLSSRLT